MKKDRNAKVLRQIRSDINQWSAGGFPPGKRLFYSIWGLPTSGGLLWASAHPALVSALIAALISVVALVFARATTATTPKTWSEALDKQLSVYQPQNLVAWEALKKTASEKGKLEVDDLERWYESEAFIVFPWQKESLRFLNPRPETKEREPLK